MRDNNKTPNDRYRNNRDYDIMSDSDETFIPGMEDIDHFDFDDQDVERFRKLNNESDDSEPQIIHKKSNKVIKREKKQHRSKKPDPNQTVYDVREKKKTNKEIMRVTYLMLCMFIGMIGYFVYFNTVVSKTVINDVHNSRMATLAAKVSRGDILSADGEILAETIEENGKTLRYYPYGCTFAHVVGTSAINKSGIELSADYSLSTSDIQSIEKVKNEILGKKNPGNDVVTSLNASLQKVAHDALGEREGAVVAIEPSTGKVLAMVSKPDYNPNTLAENYNSYINDANSKVLLNQATQGLFVPGSIFKIVTTLAYLHSNTNPDNYSYYCDGGIVLRSDDGDDYLSCYDGEEHGTVNLEESFAESCNSSFANIGTSISIKVFQNEAKKLLFNQNLPTGFTTAVSRFDLSEQDTPWQIGVTAIGQGDTVLSPMHAAMIVSAIANKGTLMEPYVIEQIVNAEDGIIKKYEPKEYGRLISEKDAATLTTFMKSVVNDGTAYRLADCDFQAAGKTGTAEVRGRGNNAWFVGFAPADNPQIAVCILVEDAGTASSEAVPIAKEIFNAYLNK